MPVTIVPRKLKAPPERKFVGASPPRQPDPGIDADLRMNRFSERRDAEQFSRELEERAAANSKSQLPNPKSNGGAPGRKRKEVSGQTGTVTEASPGAAAVSAGHSTLPPGAKPIFADPIVRLPLKLLDRHPDNRLPLVADVEARAASIRVQGVLEPIIARLLDSGRYQVLSGETRWLAVASLGEDQIPARVVECDDARALTLLAEFNAQRKDLDPIQKARLIERLCQPREAGGGGLTREQAGRIYGLESGGAVSNLVGLLRLPAIWRDRVASGELPWTWAREMLPIASLEPVLNFLDEEWQEREDEPYNAFSSRTQLGDSIAQAIRNECRQLDREYSAPKTYRRQKLKVDAKDPAVREQLGLVEVNVPGEKKPVLVATNAARFDELLAQQDARGGKGGGNQVAGGDDDEAATPAKREPTAAERREAAAKRREQLQDQIAAWRHRLLRRELALAIDEGKDNGLRLVLAFACHPPRRGPGFSMCLRNGTYLNRVDAWDDVVKFRPAQQNDAIAVVATHMLRLESDDPRQPVFDAKVIEGLAQELKIDVAEGWKRLQQPMGPKERSYDREALLEQFFQLHRTEELRELAAELGVHHPSATAGKGELLKLLMSFSRGIRPLPLPKSIKPLPAAGGKTVRKRGAK